MASSIPSMEFESSSSKLPCMYDVLINFTGDDIRKKFVSHLDSALTSVGFTTFLHHEPMHTQEPIMNLCRVAIVVFTKTYSQSAWCLYQLQQIIEWHEIYCRHVLPVYYEIHPSDVRLQKGDFGKSFRATARQTFSRQQRVPCRFRWSHALTKAANLFGWDESNYRSDAELVDKIVKTVLNLSVLSATKFPVGLQSKVEDLIRTIKNKSTEVCIIGICGEGGSGKTTLAKAIYHQIHGTFTEKSFIEDIAQVSRTRSHVSLQEQLLSDVLKIKVEIRSDEMGTSMIRERLSGKRVLIVLDDMNDYSPLLDLRKSRAWFSQGTVIIITTRDEDLLRIHHVDSVFRLKPMSANESLELLSWHTFREAKPKKNYIYIAKKVVTSCGGLPLTLEVIGTYLSKRTKEEWEIVMSKLQEIPQHDVQQKLKISFDGLDKQMEKDLFLQVCCFFVGKGRAYVTKILKDFVKDVDSGIRVLTERCLIKLKANNKFGVHPLLQEMGREIMYYTREDGPITFPATRRSCFELYLSEIRRKSRQVFSWLKVHLSQLQVVKEVPFSIARSKNIGYISLRRFEQLWHTIFPSIIRSWMSPTMNPLSYIHPFCMDMEDNSWNDLAPLLSSLANLRSILVECDTRFQLYKQVKTILVEYGVNITESRISKHHFRSSLISVGRYNKFLNTFSNSISEVLGSSETCDVSLPGDNDPYWLAHIGEGHSVSFTVPQDRDMKGMAFWVVYLSTPGIVTTECFTSVLIVNYTKCTLHMHNHGTVISFNDEDWHDIMSNLRSGDKVEIFVSFGHGLVLKNTAVYLIYGESNDFEREPVPKENSLIRFIVKIVMCDFC